MQKKRPCRICHKWFAASAREGDRQRVCKEPACQSERHRRNCEEWRRRNPGWERAERLRDRIRVEDTPAAQEKAKSSPLSGFQWGRVRDAVGVDVAVVVEEACDAVTEFARRMGMERTGAKMRGRTGRVPP